MINSESISRSEQSETLIKPPENIPPTEDYQLIQPGRQVAPPAQKKRLDALDVHRGLTMLGMILVDHRSSSPYWFIDHTSWDGLTPADLVFPSFLFIMGMAVPLAINRKKPMRIKNFIRIIALFAIGVALQIFDSKFNFNEFRIPGILQRISLCYAATIFIHILTSYGQGAKRHFGTVFVLLIGVSYTVLMLVFNKGTSQCHRSNNLTPQCNLGAYIDQKLFTKNHMIYPNDPEGLFTTLSAIVTAYIGYYFSLIMFDERGNIENILPKWTGLSIIGGIIGYGLVFLMPLNKKLWSISFTFVTASLAGFALILLVICIDLIGRNSRLYLKIVDFVIQPFIWLGRNPLAIFVLMQILAIILNEYITIDNQSLYKQFYHYVFQSWIGDKHIASFAFSLVFAVLWTAVAGVLFRFKIFVRL